MASSDAIIIDNGTGFLKAGCTSDEAPRVVIPSTFEKESAASKDVCESKKLAISKLTYERAIKRSVISNWDEIEKLWQTVIGEKLEKSAEEHPLFLTEPTFNPKGHREKMAEIAFEKFNSPSLFLGVQATLAIYAYGKMFGIVLEVGHGTARAVPVFEGFAQSQPTKKIDVAGQDLDCQLLERLKNVGGAFDFDNHMDIVDDIKKKHCFVTVEKEDQEKAKTYTLPDGKDITLASERYEIPELLFDPHKGGLDGDGVHKLIQQSIEDYGIKERLEKELCDVTSHKVSIKATDGRDNLAFIGASILTALPTFKDLWLTKLEYEESGPDLVHKKFK